MIETLAAGLQDCKLHSNWMHANPNSSYSAFMKDEQKAIVAWMRQVMDDKGWNPETWAAQAEISPTSITRAMKPDFPYVTKRQTIVSLADAAGVAPPPIAGMTGHVTINVANLEPILAALLPLAPKGRTSDQSIRALAGSLAYGLELLGDHLSTPASDDFLKAVVRGVASRFREIGSA